MNQIQKGTFPVKIKLTLVYHRNPCENENGSVGKNPRSSYLKAKNPIQAPTIPTRDLDLQNGSKLSTHENHISQGPWSHGVMVRLRLLLPMAHLTVQWSRTPRTLEMEV